MAIPIWIWGVLAAGAAYGVSQTSKKKPGAAPPAPPPVVIPPTLSCDDYFAKLPEPLASNVRKAVTSPTATKDQLEALAVSVEKLPVPDASKAAACIRTFKVGKPDAGGGAIPASSCDAEINKVPDTPVPNPITPGAYLFGGLGLRTAAKFMLASETDPKKLHAVGAILEGAGYSAAGKCLHDRAKELEAGGIGGGSPFPPLPDPSMIPTDPSKWTVT